MSPDSKVPVLQGTPYFHFIHIVLLFRRYEQISTNKVPYEASYFSGGSMIHRLQFGAILQVKSRNKAGRWYCKAKIPANLRVS